MGWADGAVWWHVYPLGFAGAPVHDDQAVDPSPVVHRLGRVTAWLDHVADLGCTGVVLGPVFASQTHGYDTIDHFRVDPRLGDEGDLRQLFEAAASRGLRVVLDGVFNHVGRAFPRFVEALRDGPDSAAGRWFRWSEPDGEGRRHPWTFEGHPGLVSLDHGSPEVADYVVDVMDHWLDRGAGGWRLDAAYAVPSQFWAPVVGRVRARHPAAVFVGEMIHGDNAQYVERSGLDSVTQYELWKAIWSSLNDANLFELAHAVKRHDALGEHFVPVTFVGNHDVTRIASKLDDPRHVGHALAVLFTVPGLPTVYAGDEFGLTGVKEDRVGGDDAVRREFPEPPARPLPPGGDDEADRLLAVHRSLIGLRRAHPWLAAGVVGVPFLRNAAAVVETVARDGGGRVRSLLNLGDEPCTFTSDVGGGEVQATSWPGGDPLVVEAHGWRVVLA